jgi:hypothetical protein
MEIKKFLKLLKTSEVRKILNKSGLTVEEYSIAEGAFIEKNYRIKTCEACFMSLSKYNILLNRVISKIESYIKIKLFD